MGNQLSRKKYRSKQKNICQKNDATSKSILSKCWHCVKYKGARYQVHPSHTLPPGAEKMASSSATALSNFCFAMPKPPDKAGPGRPKGSRNKITMDIKAMVIGALSAKGGQKYLEQQAEANPQAFMTLLGKILPTQITGDADNPVSIIHTITRKIVKDGKSR